MPRSLRARFRLTCAVYVRLGRMSANSYLSVNVYPASTSWMICVLVKEAGKPWPRLDRTVVAPLPLDGTHDLPTALEAAAAALTEEARRQRG